MNTDTGLWEASKLAPPEANRYRLGQIVELDGDKYKVLSMQNISGRGEIVLRAMSSSDCARIPKSLDEPAPRNRHERRVKARKLRSQRRSLDKKTRDATRPESKEKS